MQANYSSLILKYTAKLKRNPESSVFAPLAEIYLKMGQHEDALAILKRGLQINPQSIYGYICLSECYADRGEHELCCATLSPLTKRHPENFKLQRLFADSAYHIGQYEEALNSYKNILFLNPRDAEVGVQVKKLEDYLSNPPIKKSPSESFDVAKEAKEESVSSFFPVEGLDHTKTEESFDDWVQMDISSQVKEPIATSEQVSLESQEEPQQEAVEVKEEKVVTSYFHTSSMLDIYIGQKLWVKAEILVKELLLAEEGGEQREGVQGGLLEKQTLIKKSLNLQVESSVSSGDQLMDIFDEQVKIDPSEVKSSLGSSSLAVIKKAKLLKFLENIKVRANNIKG